LIRLNQNRVGHGPSHNRVCQPRLSTLAIELNDYPVEGMAELRGIHPIVAPPFQPDGRVGEKSFGRLPEGYQTLSTDYHLRLAIWRDTLSLIRAHPLFGTGFGTYVSVYPSVQTTSLALLVDHAHDDYLEILADLGVLGAGLLFGLVLSVPVRGISAFYTLGQTREGYLVLGGCGSILAILFHSSSDFNLQIPGNALVFAAILGLVYALSMGASRKT
jgi:O-antigen ligase